MIDALAFFDQRKEPFMAILHLFCDESGKYKKNPVVSLTGVGADKNHIDAFEKEWESLLRSYEFCELHMSRIADLSQSCGPYMPSGQTFEQRINALLPFADCINQYLEIGLAQAWDPKGYAHLTLEAKRILGGSHDLYYLMNVRAFQEIVNYVTRTDENNRVNVISDDDLTSAWDLYLHYREVKASEPKLGKALVGLTFANSQHFPALQAADLVAFLVRNQAQQDFFGKRNDWETLFGYLTRPLQAIEGRIKWFESFMNEKLMYEAAQALNELAETRKQEKENAKKQGI